MLFTPTCKSALVRWPFLAYRCLRYHHISLLSEESPSCADELCPHSEGKTGEGTTHILEEDVTVGRDAFISASTNKYPLCTPRFLSQERNQLDRWLPGRALTAL